MNDKYNYEIKRWTLDGGRIESEVICRLYREHGGIPDVLEEIKNLLLFHTHSCMEIFTIRHTCEISGDETFMYAVMDMEDIMQIAYRAGGAKGAWVRDCFVKMTER